MGDTGKRPFPQSLEENLKKALTELLILHLLSTKDYYIGELTAVIHERSHGTLNVVFPYSAIYRLQDAGYLTENAKRSAPDGRRRQYYRITDTGRAYLEHLEEIYARFTWGVGEILRKGEDSHE